MGNEEVIRFDCHDEPGHWHGGGYDRSERPGNSHRDFPKGLTRVADQVNWALQQIREKGNELLNEADYGPAAQLLKPSLVEAAIDSIRAHLDKHRDLRPKAIEENLITT